MAAYHAKHGQVMFGGHLASEADQRYAIPDNLGADSIRQIASV